MSRGSDSLDRLRRRENGNALGASQRERIVIAGDDEIGLGGERTGEHLVVVGIAGDFGNVPGHDDLHRRRIVSEHLGRGAADGRERLDQVRPAQDRGQLDQQRLAAEKLN